MIAFGVLTVIAWPAEDLTPKLLGSWKYDVATLKLDLDPNVKKAIKGDTAKKSAMDEQVGKMKSNLKRLTITFKRDGTMLAVDGKNSAPATWILKGDRVITKINGGTREGPSMTLQKDGKKLKMSYFANGMGTISCFLIKTK